MNPPRVLPRSGIEMPWYPLRSPVGIVVVRQQVGALGERAQLLVTGDDPEPVVVRAPRHRALLAQLVGLRRIRLAVLGRVLVELDDDPLVRCHRNPPGARRPVRAQANGADPGAPPTRTPRSAVDRGVADAPPLDEIELGDPRFFLRDDVDAAFARLRAESPVHRTRDLGVPPGPDFWSITRYDDVRTASRDHAPSTTRPT